MLRLRKFLLLSVLFSLLFSVSLSGEVCLEDEEFEELTAILTRWGNRLDEQQLTITSLENTLTLAETAHAKLQIETEITLLTLNALRKSYDAQNAEALKTTVIAVLISLLAGVLAGLLL